MYCIHQRVILRTEAKRSHVQFYVQRAKCVCYLQTLHESGDVTRVRLLANAQYRLCAYYSNATRAGHNLSHRCIHRMQAPLALPFDVLALPHLRSATADEDEGRAAAASRAASTIAAHTSRKSSFGGSGGGGGGGSGFCMALVLSASVVAVAAVAASVLGVRVL